ncbi:hypothetical protein ABGB07_03800 [Micromonosporaceae bacterium B7E4]
MNTMSWPYAISSLGFAALIGWVLWLAMRPTVTRAPDTKALDELRQANQELRQMVEGLRQTHTGPTAEEREN